MKYKSTFVIALALAGVAAFTLAGPQFSGNFSDNQFLVRNVSDDMETKSYSSNLDARGAKKIRVDLEYGEVELSTSRNNEFRAEVTKEMNKPVGAEERKWLENEWIRTKVEGDTLVVYEVGNEKPKLNENGKQHRSMNVKVKIQVPSNLEADLHLDAGSVLVKGDYQSIKGHLDAGEINVENASSEQFVDLDLDAGQIDAKLSKSPNRDSSLRVNAGQVDLDVKGNASVDASVGIGTIDVDGENGDPEKGLGSHKQIRVGSGGTKFKVQVDTGSISVNHGKTEKRIGSKEQDFDLGADLDQDKDTNDKIINQKDIDSAMKDAQQAIKEALGEARKAMNDPEVQKEIEQAMKDAQKEARSAMAEAQKEMEKASKEVDRELNSKEFQAEIERAMKDAQREANDAIKQAQREIEKAQADNKRSLRSEKDLSPEIKKIIRESLEMARKSLELAKVEVQKALKKSHKSNDNASV